jgi:hypothetical protein
MQTVKFVADIDATVGSLGYSVLLGRYDGSAERMTCLYVRDNTGWCVTAMIVPADTFKGRL